jgi:hypothetical protein
MKSLLKPVLASLRYIGKEIMKLMRYMLDESFITTAWCALKLQMDIWPADMEEGYEYIE